MTRRRELKAYAPFEVKEVDTEARTFSGRASTFDIDLDNERIAKGAFKKTINDWESADGKKIIPLIDQHNYHSVRSVFGKVESMTETDDGLDAKFSVVNTGDGDEYLERIKGGFLNGLSIGFEVISDTTEEAKAGDDEKPRKIRVIKELKLHEISAVIWGANPEALIDVSAVKALLAPAKDGLTREQRAEIQKALSEILEDDADTEEVEAPDEILELEKQIEDIMLMKEQAIRDEDYDAAAVLRDQQRGLEARLERRRKEHESRRPVAPIGAPDDPERLRAEALVARLRADTSRY